MEEKLTEQEELLLIRHGWKFMNKEYIYIPYDYDGCMMTGMKSIRKEVERLKKLPELPAPAFSRLIRNRHGILNEITEETIMLQEMSGAVNQWLHKKGDDVHKYGHFIDRVCDIQEVLVEALDKTL